MLGDRYGDDVVQQLDVELRAERSADPLAGPHGKAPCGVGGDLEVSLAAMQGQLALAAVEADRQRGVAAQFERAAVGQDDAAPFADAGAIVGQQVQARQCI
nr:hypothetical protein [Achromobacter sp. 2789STDY5608615]